MMVVVSEEAINQFQSLMDKVEEPLKTTFQNVHQGHPTEALERFLKAREGNVSKGHKMLVDCLNWRVENKIDDILAKPIVPTDFYRAVRNSQLIGLSGYTKEGLPIFAIGACLSTFDKASVHYYVQSHIQINEYRDRVIFVSSTLPHKTRLFVLSFCLLNFLDLLHLLKPSATKKFGRHISKCVKVLDMTGLKLSHLSLIKLLTIISGIDDLNYPEKTVTYYIVNVPYIFSACWKVVKPLLQERTRNKVQVLSGRGRDDLLKIMDHSSLPHFCLEGSGSARHSENCFSLDHPFHQQLYNYIKQQSFVLEPVTPIRQGSVHVDFPEMGVEGTKVAKTLESELQKFRSQDRFSKSLDKQMSGIDIN